jgi:hypothetical protein
MVPIQKYSTFNKRDTSVYMDRIFDVLFSQIMEFLDMLKDEDVPLGLKEITTLLTKSRSSLLHISRDTDTYINSLKNDINTHLPEQYKL